MSTLRSTVLVLVVSIATSTPLPAVATTPWPMTDGAVWRVTVSGNRVYLGGSFETVGLPARNAALLSPTNASLLSDLDVAGNVTAMAPDGAGGWFLGGYFTSVQGQPRSNLAHVGSDGNLTAWQGATNNEVYAIVLAGSALYVGGGFTQANGQPRSRLAAFDAATGSLLPWNPGANDYVNAFALSGDELYVGGSFTTLGGQSRNRIGAVDRTTGAVSAWNPNANQLVGALAVDGSHVYAAGAFTGIGDELRYRVAQLDRTTGLATSWNAQLTGQVQALALGPTSLYLAGSFSAVGGQARTNLASVSLVDGSALPWNPAPSGYVYAVASAGSVVYIGGDFTTVAGQARRGLAAIDAVTGAATSWTADVPPAPTQSSTYVYCITPAPTAVGVGGNFRLIGRSRGYLAAIDRTTRELLDWNPGASGTVFDILPSGDSVFVSGGFWQIGGESRDLVAVVDAATGTVRPFALDFSYGDVRTLELHDGALYLAGSFATLPGPSSRQHAAAFDLATGLATAWAPQPNSAVLADLVHDSNRWYYGGSFTEIGGRPRPYLAMTDDDLGAAQAGWNPGPNGWVGSVALEGGTLYVGGNITTIAGASRGHAAAVDAATGALTGWNPNASGVVRTVLPSGSSIYLGGDFTTVGGVSRPYLARVDAATGALDPWDPTVTLEPYGVMSVYELALDDQHLFVGGYFTRATIAGEERDHFAVIPNVNTVGVSDPTTASNRMLLPVTPNPVRARSELRFALPRSANVRLSVFDVTGRAIARPIENRPMDAGLHRVGLEGFHLAPGVYLVRLEAGGRTEAGRFVVLE